MARKPLSIRDDLGEMLSLNAPPQRIVSLVPSITETLIDLGAGDRLVGITTYCVHPAHAVDKIARVGGTKSFSLEKIDALRPELVIANKEENRKRHIEALRRKYPVFVTYPRTVEAAVAMVIALGRITGREATAAHFAEGCDRLLTSGNPVVTGPRVRAACMIWRDPWMAAGPDSYVSDLLDTFGFENVFAPDEGRYPETTLEDVIDRRPAVILLPDEPYAFGDADRDEVAACLAGRGLEARVLLTDGSYLTWFGTRTLRALEHLYRLKADLTLGTR